MAPVFKIAHFPSTEAISKEVCSKLNRDDQLASLVLLDTTKTYTVEDFVTDGFKLVVLLLSELDLATIIRKEEDSIKYKPLNSSFVVVCVGFKLPGNTTLGAPESIQTECSSELIRQQIIEYYRKVTKGASYVSFVGRSQEIEKFQNILYSERFSSTKVVIVSGHLGVGREAFARECIRQVCKECIEPCLISLGDNGNVELFLVQLNSINRDYSEEDFKKLLSSSTGEKIEAAVALLNSLFKENRYLIVYDDSRSCIRFDRKLSDWFREVISHPGLIGGMHMFVISPVAVNYSKTKALDGASFFTLFDLSTIDRKKLIYRHLADRGLAAPEEDVDYILSASIYSPHLIIKVVDDYCNHGGISYTKRHVNDYMSVGDAGVRTVLKQYKIDNNPDLWNILVLLSRIEYMRHDVLKTIFDDTLFTSNLDNLVSDGLVEQFGEMNEYYRLDSSVADNIRRNRDRYLDNTIQGHIDEIMALRIESNPRITIDYSSFLYKLKEDLMDQKKNAEAFLLPSILISSIVESYERKKYDLTIDLCSWVLSEKPHYFSDVYREIHYWECLALARNKDNRFYEAVDYFRRGDDDYHFLQGFMYRINRQYAKAEAEYRSALKINPSFGRAKRELVTVLQGQHKFSEALELARENYERDRDNSYHLLAYYRCLVRKRGLTYEDRQELIRLQNDARSLFSSDYFVEGMGFEFQRFVEKPKMPELFNKAHSLEQLILDTDSAYLKDIIREFRFAQGLESNLKPTEDLDDELDR